MYSIGSPPKKYKDTSSTLIDTWLLLLLKVMGCDNLLLDHVELPHVLDLAVHLFQLVPIGRGGHNEHFP